MALTGRKRNEGSRTPSGQLSRALQSQKTAGLAARARDDVLRALGHPELGTVAGKWFLMAEIPLASWDAAQKLSRLSAEYDIAIGAPARSPLAQDVNRSSKATGDGAPENVAWKQSRVDAMDRVKAVLGVTAFRAVERVVIEDRHPDDYAQRLACIEALRVLAIVWGIVRA